MDIDSKAKVMAKQAETRLNPEALEAYRSLALKKTEDYDGLVLKSDGKTVSLEAKSSPSSPIASLVPESQPRFLVVQSKGKLVLVLWKPAGAKPMDLMKYNSVTGGVEKDLGNLKATTAGEKQDLLGLIG